MEVKQFKILSINYNQADITSVSSHRPVSVTAHMDVEAFILNESAGFEVKCRIPYVTDHEDIKKFVLECVYGQEKIRKQVAERGV